MLSRKVLLSGTSAVFLVLLIIFFNLNPPSLFSNFDQAEKQNILGNQELSIVNSNELKNDLEIAEEIKQFEARTIEISFIGDIMVDRFIRKVANQRGYNALFDNVRKNFLSKDLVIANLEGPVTNYKSIHENGIVLDQYIFTFNPDIVSALQSANIKAITVDNNHITDFGKVGIEQTERYLKNSSIGYVGNPYDRQILYKEIGGVKLGLVSYNQFILPDQATTINQIKEAKRQADHVIVYTHWGNEYELIPTSGQIDLAHQFVDAGADIVIGAHPHVIQSKEIYKGKYIYYSLGNFIFDQYFNVTVRCGAVVTFRLDKEEIYDPTEDFIYLDPQEIVSYKDCLQKIPSL